MSMSEQERIETAARRLEYLARKLRIQARPGHVEYTSKADAAANIESIITDLLTLEPVH